jgi:hypothetical protein
VAAAAWRIVVYLTWQPDFGQSAVAAALVAVLVLAWRAAGIPFGLHYLGDAARYLSPVPPNIGVRHAIRAAALDLLRGLHDDPLRRYQRIVVVGHSLGSVIAYDALTYLWQERHHPPSHMMTPPARPAPDDPTCADRMSPCAYRLTQSRVWREQRAMGVPWKITDLVTLGSPLAHASFLMAKDECDFCRSKRQREFPTCPPQGTDSRDEEYGESLLEVAIKGKKYDVLLHHAALFACTRWTNLYFESDWIGGPPRKMFGWGILERALEPRSLRGRLPTSHVRYWNESEGAALEELGKALDLNDWWTPENTVAAACMEGPVENELRTLNVEMAREETNGNTAYFEELLAPTFAFQEPHGDFVDRETFLGGLKAGGPQRECDPYSINVTRLGEKRALVTCIVRQKMDVGWTEFDDARLFVLAGECWRLLAWASEPRRLGE